MVRAYSSQFIPYRDLPCG